MVNKEKSAKKRLNFKKVAGKPANSNLLEHELLQKLFPRILITIKNSYLIGITDSMTLPFSNLLKT